MTEKFIVSETSEGTDFSDVLETETDYPSNSVFIKGDMQNGKYLWGIYDSEGTRMALVENRDCAFVVARQNDFIPYSVH